MNNGNVSRVFSTTLNNLKRLFKPDQQLEPKQDPEPEQIHVAARVANPWQEELDRLVANRFQPKENFSEPINEQLSNLTQIAQDAQQKAAQKKAKRSGDGTVTDLKAWWGESVATWDPELAGTVDTSEQKSKMRSLKRWFT